MLSRRGLLAGALAVAGVGAARAHTPFRQWVVYRKKHLLIGCHRRDDEGYALAKSVAGELAARLPTSRARVARAPAPSRLASLLATDQLDVAVLDPATAAAMVRADGVFAAYGELPLRTLVVIQEGHALLAHARFPDDHASLVTDALQESPLAPASLQQGEPAAPWHPGRHLPLAEAGNDALPADDWWRDAPQP